MLYVNFNVFVILILVPYFFLYIYSRFVYFFSICFYVIILFGGFVKVFTTFYLSYVVVHFFVTFLYDLKNSLVGSVFSYNSNVLLYCDICLGSLFKVLVNILLYIGFSLFLFGFTVVLRL